MAKTTTKKRRKKAAKKTVEVIRHEDASRPNIPTAELKAVMSKEDQSPIQIAYERRNRDLDPQLVWRGKDEQDRDDLVVQAPPLYIQEKVHPKTLVDDLMRRTQKDEDKDEIADSLFASVFDNFDGLEDSDLKTEFYQHEANWSNRMILGDSLQVMASLAEREGLRGKVQCIYMDPPYGINFSSNWQVSTKSRDVKDGKIDHITREPEMVRAFRDTWRDGTHSYLTYLRDRLTAARGLLKQSGSIFVQIGDENVHHVRSLMDEVFGPNNYITQITYKTNTPLGEDFLPSSNDFILWYAIDKTAVRPRNLFLQKDIGSNTLFNYCESPTGERRALTSAEKLEPRLIPPGHRPYFLNVLLSGGYTTTCTYPFELDGTLVKAQRKSWRTHSDGMCRLIKANRLTMPGKLPYMVGYHDDFPVKAMTSTWNDTRSAMNKVFVVQTQEQVVQRCLLMATDPGDLVLDPTCGSGTTATVAEQWGRRWITIDTSRVALALARARLMGMRYPYFLLSDSRDGQLKEAGITRDAPSESPTHGSIRHGFVYERVPHVMLKSIANNTEIDVIWDNFQEKLEPLREQLNSTLGESWEEWEIPRDAEKDWSDKAKKLHADWWKLRIERQQEIDASIAAKADFEYLYDRPYEDKSKVRVAGPMTIESISPHRVLGVDENDGLIDPVTETDDYTHVIIENLKTAGVQQSHKEDKIVFSSISPWAGQGYIAAEGRYTESDSDDAPEKRAAIFIGPEFGTVSRQDLVAAAREAGEADFNVLIACAFNYEALTTEFDKLGKVRILKARMNADLHMAKDLKKTAKANLFVIFGEPDIDVLDADNGKIKVKINGVDVFHPASGEVRSDNADGIACWFIDTDYNEESFFVRHAYFLGAGDPYKSLKTTLKAEINQEAWDTLNSDTSRPFSKPDSGRIAVKVINHLGDEVMKVFRVD